MFWVLVVMFFLMSQEFSCGMLQGRVVYLVRLFVVMVMDLVLVISGVECFLIVLVSICGLEFCFRFGVVSCIVVGGFEVFLVVSDGVFVVCIFNGVVVFWLRVWRFLLYMSMLLLGSGVMLICVGLCWMVGQGVWIVVVMLMMYVVVMIILVMSFVLVVVIWNVCVFVIGFFFCLLVLVDWYCWVLFCCLCWMFC